MSYQRKGSLLPVISESPLGFFLFLDVVPSVTVLPIVSSTKQLYRNRMQDDCADEKQKIGKTDGREAIDTIFREPFTQFQHLNNLLPEAKTGRSNMSLPTSEVALRRGSFMFFMWEGI